MDTRQENPLAVITGASSGIGYELAKQFASHGYDLAIAAEDEGIHDVAVALQGLHAKVWAFQVDLSTYEGSESFAQAVQDLNVPVSALALNAGVGVGGEFAVSTSLDAELALIRLNIQSLVHLSKRIVPGMLARQQGRILYTSSLASSSPGPYYAVYAASKAFVQSFAEALRYELRDSGVSVTSLMPGPTDTNFFARAGMEETKAGRGPKDDPAEVAALAFEALMEGKDHVVTGLRNKVQNAITKILPESVAAGMHATQTKPDSTQHDKRGLDSPFIH